ncbi:DUF7827 domain-containing protein [Halogeometricum limi]|uniref:PGF-CTERM protein/surface glycoprotein n=1 Tax=Halogeometricum limi TaxID=555875 RepID=A0A1I6HMK5_9EURY|nr:BGTF surface domain-containing protein [Halogeometricum limi]SFR55699.1 PGF-CTERM protein/surface glycoprotein [Halogeometricum limi]
MTSNTKQFRAVFLAALMVMSVFAGTVAFAGSAAAASGATVDVFQPDTVDEGTTNTHNVNVSFTGYSQDASDDYINVTLPAGTVDSESLTVVNATGDEIPSTVTTSGASANVTIASGAANVTSQIYLNGSFDAAVPNVTSTTNADVSFELVDSAGSDVSDTAGLTITNTDGSQSGSPSYLESVHYDETANDGNTEIELSFSEPVNNLDGAQLYIDDEPVGTLSDVASDAGGSITNTDGRYVVPVDGDMVNTGDITVRLTNSITDGSNALSNTGNKTVEVAPVTVDSSNTDVNAYKGSKVAVVAASDSTSVEIEGDDSDYFVSGSTGDNSNVFVFATENRDIDTYNVSVGGSSSYEAQINLRNLGLDVSVDDLNITNSDDDLIEGTVSANAANRPIAVELVDADDETVKTIGATLNGQAEYEYTFNASDLDAGNYTVVATDNQSGVTAESSSIVVSKAGEGRADIGAGGIVTEERGDIANITVELQNTDTATLTIGESDVGFVSNVTVVDDDGDGMVNVSFNTYAASGLSGSLSDTQAETLYSVGEDDEIDSAEIDSDNSVSELLDAGEYPLEVQAGTGTSPDDAQGVGTLVLEERNTSSIQSWTAPSDAEIENKGDVYAAINNSNITQDDEIAYGDLAVHQVEASGLEGALEATDDDTTAAFFQLIQNDAINLTVEQTEAGANRDPFMLALGEDNTTVIADAENDTYFVMFDTDAVNTMGDARDLEADDGLTANFTVTDETGLAEDDQSVEDEYELIEAEHTLDDVEVAASANQSIAGETTVAPGTEINLRVRSDGDTQPSFLKTATAYVTENGTYEAAFDFSEQSANDTFTVTVRGGVADSITADGTVTEGDGNMTETGTETGTGTDTGETDTPTDTGETDTPTDTGETDTPTDTGETDTPTDGGETETGTETNTPGFGAVVAVTALLAAALLAVRRD